MSASIEVYWQPGCSSCLRVKEFLSQRGIEFESRNIVDERSLVRLRALGAQTVPVVARGGRYVLAQRIENVIEFLELDELPPVLFECDVLLERLELVVSAAMRYALQFPADALERVPAERTQQTYRELVFHALHIPSTFLLCARGGALTFELATPPPPKQADSFDALASYGKEILEALREWRSSAKDVTWGELARTHYGRPTLHELLERTTWHVAQHTRQIMALLHDGGTAPDVPLTAADLDGLPMPVGVWS